MVAHPPCAPWSKLRHLASGKYLGAGEQLAMIGAWQVRLYGGVLEHPAESQLFDRCLPCYLPHPGDPPDPWGGFTIEVDQCEWGHVARKRTWLYLVGIPRSATEPPPYFGREPTHWVSGRRRRGGTSDGQLVPPGLKVCSKQQRNRTPPEFAAYLVRLARACTR